MGKHDNPCAVFCKFTSFSFYQSSIVAVVVVDASANLSLKELKIVTHTHPIPTDIPM